MNFQHSPTPRQRSNTAPKTPTTPDIHQQEYLFSEISILLRANGDGFLDQQNRDAIILVEKLVIQQLRGIISEATDVAFKRSGSTVPSQCDFEFMMRRNPAKLQRFKRYMKNVHKLKLEQKQGIGIEFLNRLAEDNTNEEDEREVIYDPEKTRRLFRADRISTILSPQKYEEFQRARTWSSNIRNKMDMYRKLVEILPISKEMQDHFNCQEIIIFMLQETIATIVDFAILTRLNSDNRVITDPFTIPSNISHNNFCPEVTQGRGLDGLKSITVQEINEAMRRVATMTTRRMGTSFKSNGEFKFPLLAI